MPSFLTRKYQCPECDGEFHHLHEIWGKTELSPPPNHCPLCGEYVGPEKKGKKKLKPPKPRDSTTGGGKRARLQIRSEDQVYRQMESASEYRMEQAAELLGCSKSELSDMKLTNMKDNVRAGESSHIPSAATQIQGTTAGNMTFQDRTAGSEYAKTVGTGPHPYAGNRAREMIVSGHQSRVHSTVAAGQLNKKG